MSAVPPLFDRSLLDRHRARAARADVAGSDFLLVHAADDLLERLATVNRSFELAVDLGSPTPDLADRLVAGGKAARVIRIDRLENLVRGGRHAGIVGDEEVLPLAPGSVDLVVSVLALQWVNDLPGALAQIRRALKPDGLFLATLLGGETLAELRLALTEAESEIRGGAAPRVAPFADIRDLGALLQRAGFALPVTDTDRLTVRYDTAFHLMRDLRAMGATNVLSARDPRPLTRAILARTAAIYAERFSDADGRIRATFQTVALSGWAPHESQPKPLRPGSAKMRLSDAIAAAAKDDGAAGKTTAPSPPTPPKPPSKRSP